MEKLNSLIDREVNTMSGPVTTVFQIVSLICILCLPGCKSAKFESGWNDDTNTWKVYKLNGVDFRIPSELPLLKMNPKVWWFVINAQQVDNFSQGVDQGISIRVELGTRNTLEIEQSEMAQNMINSASRIYPVETPVKGLKFIAANVFQGNRPNGNRMEGTVITGSTFGYIFKSKSGSIVMVSVFKRTHEPIPYERWQTEIFTQRERSLVEQVAASVK